MKNRNLIHKDDWETPRDFYNKIDQEFHFNFDPCPINPNFNGLEIEWGTRNYINPPYSMDRIDFQGIKTPLKEAFIRKSFIESQKGKLCVMLLPVSTSTKIFHEIIYPNAEIRFLKRRLKFIGINTFGIKVSNKCGQHDSMLAIFKGCAGI